VGTVTGGTVADRHGYRRSTFAAAGWEHPVYRDGSGPVVILLHEMPVLSWRTIQLADHIGPAR
jgi:hypothetical protein